MSTAVPTLPLEDYLRRLPGRCPSCLFHIGTQGCHCAVAPIAPTALRDAGQAIASAAHPGDRARVDAAIRQLAATGRPFSANDARQLHGVRGGVVGAAFTAARKAGLIERIGREPSSAASTHGHEIGQWLGANANGAAA